MKENACQILVIGEKYFEVFRHKESCKAKFHLYKECEGKGDKPHFDIILVHPSDDKKLENTEKMFQENAILFILSGEGTIPPYPPLLSELKCIKTWWGQRIGLEEIPERLSSCKAFLIRERTLKDYIDDIIEYCYDFKSKGQDINLEKLYKTIFPEFICFELFLELAYLLLAPSEKQWEKIEELITKCKEIIGETEEGKLKEVEIKIKGLYSMTFQSIINSGYKEKYLEIYTQLSELCKEEKEKWFRR